MPDRGNAPAVESLAEIGPSVAKASGNVEDSHRLLYGDLQSWLCRDDSTAPYRNASDLMQAIISEDQEAYFHAQTDALAYLVWLKKLACAYLERGTDR